jgi:60 kDa SS-A/Ro ribonucleoprotein
MNASRYARSASTRQTPQSQPIPGKPMEKNNAGGFSFVVDHWKQLERFLILGTMGGSYYVTEQKMTQDSIAVLAKCVQEDAKRVLEMTRRISLEALAPKNDQAVFVLAYLAGQKEELGQQALAALNDICRTGYHLFQFVDAVEQFRGWGRGLKRAIQNWYLSRPADQAAYQAVKYQSRVVSEGGKAWSHRDVLRLSKPKVPSDSPHGKVFDWIAHGRAGSEAPAILGFEAAKAATSAKEIIKAIETYQLPREAIPTEYLNEPKVWEALLPHMGLTAMVRNLGKMTSIDLIKPLSSTTRFVTNALTNPDRLKKERVHPFALLLASKVYANGKGVKGSLTWNVDQRIISALDDGFYKAFQYLEPTNKKYLLGVDVSGSMHSSHVASVPGLSAAEAATALALIPIRTEEETHVVAFTAGRNGRYDTAAVTPLAIGVRDTIPTAIAEMRKLNFGGTDCALPMLYALAHKIEVDVFVIYTDNESWAGQIHASQALQMYREQMNRPAKLIVCALTATRFSVADPKDAGQLDIVGASADVPAVMASFVK